MRAAIPKAPTFVLEEPRDGRSQVQQADAHVARPGVGWNQHGKSEPVLHCRVNGHCCTGSAAVKQSATIGSE